MSSQATYQHRKGPNVSQFIASLNAMPSTAEDPNSKNDPNAQTDGFGVGDDDLDLFMHTEFLQDFDDDFSNPLGHTLDDSPIDFDPGRPLHQSSTPSNLAADASAPAATAATLGGGPTATSNANTDMKTNLNFEDGNAAPILSPSIIFLPYPLAPCVAGRWQRRPLLPKCLIILNSLPPPVIFRPPSALLPAYIIPLFWSQAPAC